MLIKKACFQWLKLLIVKKFIGWNQKKRSIFFDSIKVPKKITRKLEKIMTKKLVIEDESVKYMPEVDNISDTQNTENEVDQNDVNDDLLQIPAFLRRQAN